MAGRVIFAFVKIIGRLGIRARLALVLTVSALLGALVLVSVMRPIYESLLPRQAANRLLSLARLASVTAPDDAGQWDEWARQLPAVVPELHAFILSCEPGEERFFEQCNALDLNSDHAAQAFSDGELLARTTVVEGGDKSLGWQALSVLQDKTGKRGLLILTEREQARSFTRFSWGLASLYGVLVLIIAWLGGFLAGYFLVIRPVASAARNALKSDSAMAQASDLDIIQTVLKSSMGVEKELSNKLMRQEIRIREMQSDLKGAQAGLLRAEKLASVGQLAAGIAHEIGNPIGIILGLSEILKDGCEPEEAKVYANQIHAATLRVHGTLRDLLSFARPAKEEGAVADVKEVVEQTLSLLASNRLFNHLNISKSYDSKLHLAEIKPSQLQQVLVNLLLNAAHATDGKGSIEIELKNSDQLVEIRISDDGPGIEEKDLDRIFDPFYSTKPQGEGTGLGLSICAQIVEVYGGDIKVESSPGNGAVFTIKLWSIEDSDSQPN
ncbi:MAG: sensor histidine kinase [Myxococcota bacterium]|nr:GHKL domain-containing protein [Myxococcota bacterium]HQC43957.1 ATP-binding protein [Myxococcota bacterium]